MIMRNGLLIFLLIINSIVYSQNEIYINYVERPIEYEMYSAPDSLGNVKPVEFPHQNKSINDLLIPYPIVLIHGLAGDASTWNTFTYFLRTQYNFNYGGRFDFCLNYDLDNTVANLDYYDIPGADMAIFTPTLVVGEYYKINFDVGYNGMYFEGDNSDYDSQYDVNSNQQAIMKQGKALRWAIYKILEETGADKVILMGHSMGGLTAREYLQNSDLWQPDGKHHVAKLITTGTPHGGSNATSSGTGVGSDVNEKLDATRDLRRDYYWSDAPGVYLFGGVESNSVMWNNLVYDYKNIDVNCNGIIGEVITGLNEKPIYTNLAYSCIIGTCSGCILDTYTGGSDGVVRDYCADLKTYYNIQVDRFYQHSSATIQTHTDLPKQIYENMQGLDEANELNLAYEIGFDKTYIGFVTVQSSDSYSRDYDMYKFTVNNETSVKVNIDNIPVSDFSTCLKDMQGNIIEEAVYSNSLSSIEFERPVSQGEYILEISSFPTTTSYYYPYSYKLTNTTGINDVSSNKIIIYPNPAKNYFTVKLDNNKDSHLQILDVTGKVIYQKNFNKELLVETKNFNNGIYFVRIKNDNNVITEKIIIE